MSYDARKARIAEIVMRWQDDYANSPNLPSLDDLIERLTVGYGAPREEAASPSVERYCVIGTDAYSRRWYERAEDAIVHAGHLFNNGSSNKTKKLLVVKVEKVIERVPPSPPPVSTRDPVATDFPDTVRHRS